ncbi:phosphomannose isomerase type II C-terminal cupin domain [Candidatus Parcubacteria bacterium]|nr:phosphomannose isomerase type II C-terminal cupin domain [Candidatus Parcubacteria bacterium]
MALKTETRPWGNFIQFTLNEPSTVKLITVNPGQEFSLQYHHKRRELWRILSGHPIITVGDKVVKGRPGDEIEVPEETNHRIKAEDEAVEILEISLGEFDENDIVRLKDNYGRVK